MSLDFSAIDFIQVFLFAVPFALILLINAQLDKYTDWPREVHRKFGHILSGLTIITASYFLNYPEMILFAVGLMIGALGTRVLKLKTVHQVKRKSIGTFLFALVTLVLTYMWFKENPDLLRYGIWILTIPDALAAVIGSQYGNYIERFGKSYLGSTVFFVGVLGLTYIFSGLIIPVLLIAFVLTLIEFFTIYGLDNLTLPIAGSYLLSLFV